MHYYLKGILYRTTRTCVYPRILNAVCSNCPTLKLVLSVDKNSLWGFLIVTDVPIFSYDATPIMIEIPVM